MAFPAVFDIIAL